jgi:signal transduction histidine kinase
MALVALELLIVAGCLTSVYALRISAAATEHLAEERLTHMQDAQDLVQRTLLIERGTARMLATQSLDEMRLRYDETIEQLDSLNRVVQRLSAASADVSVLALHQSEQLFRNEAIIVAELRGKQLQAGVANESTAPGSSSGWEETLRRYHGKLQHEAVTMVASAQELSSRFTGRYREAVRKVADISNRNERRVLVLFVGGLIMAWQVSVYFSRHVLARLQEVSNSLRQGNAGSDIRLVPVQGADEISEMARAVEKFLEDRRRLAEAHEELEAFSYSVSHDLRAPLRSIDGFCELLIEEHGNQLDEEGRAYLNTIQQSDRRMRDLIDDLLAFSRMSRSEMALESVNITTMAQEVFEDARRPVPERNIVLRVGELPPAKGDSALIRQVLVNLISNAVKFTATRDEAIVELDCVETGAMNTYRIKDNGVGFDMRYAHKLFGVFERLHGAEKFEGNGIGLAIVKRVIVRHGGQVRAESKPGEGASIYFTLPPGSYETLLPPGGKEHISKEDRPCPTSSFPA